MPQRLLCLLLLGFCSAPVGAAPHSADIKPSPSASTPASRSAWSSASSVAKTLALLLDPASLWTGHSLHAEQSGLAAPAPRLLPQKLQEKAKLEKLIQHYAPRIWWHPKEKYGPMDPTHFIRNSSLWHRPKNGKLTQIAAKGRIQPQELSRQGDYVLQYEDQIESAAPPSGAIQAPIFWKISRHPVMDQLGKLNRARSPQSEGSSRVLIEYWYHVAYSDANLLGIGNHQGDWEGIALLLDLHPGPEGELSHRPLAAYYAAHDGGTWHCPDELSWVKADGQAHPEAFSALGTHASYARPGNYRRFVLVDRAERGRSWDTWNSIRPLELEPYARYRGLWGSLSFFQFMSGPRVPSPGLKEFPKGSAEKELARLADLQNRCSVL